MKTRPAFHRLRTVLVTAWLILPAGLTASGDVPAPPADIEEELPGLSLAGTGGFSVMFWDIYTAALWVTGGEYSPETPHVLALRYARDFEGDDIAERSIREIRDLGLGNGEQHDAWLESMLAVFPDVAEGDQLTGLHLPGEKAVFYRNGQRIGEIADAGFARAFFAIWLDEKTAAPDLRRQLLGLDGSEVSATGNSRITAGTPALPPAGSI